MKVSDIEQALALAAEWTGGHCDLASWPNCREVLAELSAAQSLGFLIHTSLILICILGKVVTLLQSSQEAGDIPREAPAKGPP